MCSTQLPPEPKGLGTFVKWGISCLNHSDHGPMLSELAVPVTQWGSPAGWNGDEVSRAHCHLRTPYFFGRDGPCIPGMMGYLLPVVFPRTLPGFPLLFAFWHIKDSFLTCLNFWCPCVPRLVLAFVSRAKWNAGRTSLSASPLSTSFLINSHVSVNSDCLCVCR